MAYLPLALLAYFLNSIAVLVDKFLLKKHFQDPLVYIFYISIFSTVALFGLPLTHVPSIQVILFASVSTLLWTTGAYFLYNALRFGNASRVIPLIGVLIPLLLLSFSSMTHALSQTEVVAILVLVGGLISLTFQDWKGAISKEEFISEVVSAVFFAVSYLVLKQAYMQESFITVLVWSRMILIPLGLFLFFWPPTAHIIRFQKKDKGKRKLPAIFFLFGQVCGGASEILLTFSISLAQPALVNSLQGSQYVFLFIFSLFLTKKFPAIFHEEKNKTTKLVGIALIGVGLYLLAFTS